VYLGQTDRQTAMSIKRVFFLFSFLIHECYIRSIKRYCFVRKCAAVQYSLKLSFSNTLAGVYLPYGFFFFNSAASASF
jgi:hypothetical protein